MNTSWTISVFHFDGTTETLSATDVCMKLSDCIKCTLKFDDITRIYHCTSAELRFRLVSNAEIMALGLAHSEQRRIPLSVANGKTRVSGDFYVNELKITEEDNAWNAECVLVCMELRDTDWIETKKNETC